VQCEQQDVSRRNTLNVGTKKREQNDTLYHSAEKGFYMTVARIINKMAGKRGRQPLNGMYVTILNYSDLSINTRV
jgi:hypothetical protein